MTRPLFCAAALALLLTAPVFHGRTSAQEAAAQQRLQALRHASKPQVAPRLIESVAYLFENAEAIAARYPKQGQRWRRKATRYLHALEQGRDPYQAGAGKIDNRGYRSRASQRRQGYAVYLPKNYDPKRCYPLYVALHGGSSNGNLFLGVVLGNNMPWKRYKEHLWDTFEARWHPESIVVAPDGFGQVMWRWMGEQDVLDVIEDVQANYSVDANRIVLGGLSNGGVGAYAIGLRHAWRFAAVQAMAGAPSWKQYARSPNNALDQRLLTPWSGLDLAENAQATDFRYYHGKEDGGPMRPAYVEAFTRRLEGLGVAATEQWYNTGHDILYLVHRHGRGFAKLGALKRDPHPHRVVLASADYRAARQHWLEVTRIANYPSLARVEATVEGTHLTLTTRNATALRIRLDELPERHRRHLRVVIDRQWLFHDWRSKLPKLLELVKIRGKWRMAAAAAWDAQRCGPAGLSKQPGRSGPLTDAYYERMVHVYGTLDEQSALRAAAERGARGWPVWLWGFEQEVVADTAVDQALMNEAHLVLYGTPATNAVLRRVADRLPLQVEADSIRLGDKRIDGNNLGARYIVPNPLAPHRYLTIQTGHSPRAIAAGHKLPDFLPDYVVYDASKTTSRPRLLPRRRPVAEGFFDACWRPNPQHDGEPL